MRRRATGMSVAGRTVDSEKGPLGCLQNLSSRRPTSSGLASGIVVDLFAQLEVLWELDFLLSQRGIEENIRE